MTNDVFANNNEVSCKAGQGKSICAFPDICMTPPENPATPPGVPVPYPNTGLASDTTDGSKTVNISGKEVMLKNKSYFKRSVGDEAGCAAKKGVVTSVNKGKVYFISWSMDVKIEGENVVRNLDMTTHNHPSSLTNTPPTIHIDSIAITFPENCRETVEQFQAACSQTPDSSGNVAYAVSGSVSAGNRQVTSCSDECRKKQRCILIPKEHDDKFCCPETEIEGGRSFRPDDTLRSGHHLIEDHWLKTNPNFPWYSSGRGALDARTVVPAETPGRNRSRDPRLGDDEDAPTVCTNSFPTPGTLHNMMHNVQGTFIEKYNAGGGLCKPGEPSNGFNYGAAKECALLGHRAAFSESDCSGQCLIDQLDAFYGDDNTRPMNLPTKKQGLGHRRGELHDRWGNVRSGSEGLKASIGSILSRK